MKPKRKSAIAGWQVLRGIEIAEALEDQDALTRLVDPCQAVYIWRRSFEPPPDAARSSDELIRWTERLLATPHGAALQKRLGHFIQIDGVTLRGPGLTPDKLATLQRVASSPRWRRMLTSFIRSLAPFAPPLYVGETSDLPIRLRDHVNGDTGFGRKVRSSKELRWSELDLHYFALGDAREEDESTPEAKARRTLLEYIATGASLAGYVERPG